MKIENNISSILFILWVLGMTYIWLPSYFPFYIKISPSITPTTIMSVYVTILAILPAVTLAGAAIAASSYSFKILENLKKDIYFWSLICLYLAVIGISFGMLFLNVKSLKPLVSYQFTSLLGLFFLLPYFINNVKKIQFEEIITQFTKKIRKKEFLPLIFNEDMENDPASPLFDIMTKSISNNDIASFKLILKSYVDQIILLLKEFITEPINMPPQYSDSGIIQKADWQIIYREQSVLKITDFIFEKHFQRLQDFCFKENNETALIEIPLELSRLAIESWHFVERIGIPLSHKLGERCAGNVFFIGKKACDKNMLDLLNSCMNAEADMGKFFAKNGPEQYMFNISGFCEDYIEDLFKKFMKNQRTNFDITFILRSTLNNEIEIITKRLLYMPYNVYQFDFYEIEEHLMLAKKFIFVPEDYYLQNLTTPIIVQMLMKDGSTAIDKILTKIQSSSINQDITFLQECYHVLHERLNNTEIPWQRYYANIDVEEWYNQIIKIIERLEQASICEYLLILWIAARKWDKVVEIGEVLHRIHFSIKSKGGEYARSVVIKPLDILDETAYVSLYLGDKETFLKIVNILIETSAKDKNSTGKIATILTLLGVYACMWDKKDEEKEILKNISLMIDHIFIYNKRKLGSILRNQTEILASLSGLYHSRVVNNIAQINTNQGFFLHKTINKSERDEINQEKSKEFTEHYMENIIGYAHYMAKNLSTYLKNNH